MELRECYTLIPSWITTQCDPPLSWGLQFIVRGDLALEGGAVLTLDELSDELGLPRLPYLEELPDELDLGELG